jgi:hypothetical protein
VLLTVAEELETCCNNIINQALGGTFASRPIPKYYPPHPYNPEKDSDGQAAGQMLSAKQENKPEKWTLQQEKGESWNKKHRLFLDAVIANDLHTVVEMVKVQEENACRNDFVSHVCLFSKDREKNQLDIDYVDINGISALYWSAIMGHAQIAQFLIPAGGNVHLRDLTGGTPLHAAAYQGNQTIVSLLIKVFFFFFFFSLGSLRLFVLLKIFCFLFLKAGADCNARNNAGQTPLHRASVSGLSGGIVVCVGLVESGCDVTTKVCTCLFPPLVFFDLAFASGFSWKYCVAFGCLARRCASGGSSGAV